MTSPPFLIILSFNSQKPTNPVEAKMHPFVTISLIMYLITVALFLSMGSINGVKSKKNRVMP